MSRCCVCVCVCVHLCSHQAAESIAERAASSPRWRRAFVRMGGIQTLLKLLRGGVDADTVRAVIKALAELLKESAAHEVGGEELMLVGLCEGRVHTGWNKKLK